MKLNNIKIAGFKTFVDPTFLALKGQLVGVVGPNGCGKSNIIDAVRWVMGEGSAKALRGESMADVIFNGSSGRQPVGRASVELCFDNKDGSLGGEYAKYSEISIKREVTRDGQSDYYLNSTRCRKKDIVDIFLGTGLGPRSYSIIEQGMISRVIESKAESLREFFEEAAGTSVYKRRRHDTELRMRHTIENLNQLEYLMQEQTKQLEKLKKQSSDARKFNEYQKERVLLDSQVSVLKYQEYETYLQCDSGIIRDLAIDLEQALASRASLDADLEKMRAIYTEKNDQVNKIQSVYYDLGSEIARKEQILQHQRERLAEVSTEFKSILITHDNLNEELAKDNAIAMEIEEKLIAIEPEYIQANMQLENSSNLLEDAEIKLQEWNETWEQYSKNSQDTQQQAEVGKEKITQLERQTRDLQVRLDRLAQERQTLHPEQKQQLVAELIAKNK
jgi:chromosome segregation protein